MDLGIIVLLVFVAGILVVLTAYFLSVDIAGSDRARTKKRMDAAFEKDSEAEAASLFKTQGSGAGLFGRAAPEWRKLGERLSNVVVQAGLDKNWRGIIWGTCAGGLLFGLAAGLASGSILVGIATALAAPVVTSTYIGICRNARTTALRLQLPDAYGLMSRVMRAGRTTSEAIQAVSQDFSAPIAEEFAQCYEEQKMGVELETALRNLGRRTGVLEIKMMIVAVVIHGQSGGNLAEMLDRLAAVIRERVRIRGIIRSVTVEGRLQAAILLALPFVVFMLMFFLNPGYVGVLLTQPQLIAGMLVAEMVGALWIRRIVNFDF